MTLPNAQRAARVAVALYIALICFATLTPRPPAVIPSGPWCIVCGELGGVDVLQNIALFLPLGALLVLAGLPAGRATLACMLLSLSIELLQIRVVSGRDASLSDVLTNTAGALLGSALAAHRAGWLRPAPPRALHLAVSWSIAVSCLLGLLGVLVQPSTRRFDAYVQLLPVRSYWDSFAGRLVDARLEGRTVAIGQLASNEVRYRALTSGRYRAEVAVRSVTPTRRFAAIFRIANRRGELFFLGQQDLDALFRPRLRSSDFLLFSPAFAIRDGLATGDSTVRFRAELARGEVVLNAASSIRKTERRILLSPSLGWATLVPWQVTLKGDELLLGAIFLALLTIPAGYWSGLNRLATSRAERPAVGEWLLPPLLITVGLIVAVAIAGTDSAKPTEVVGILLGFATGMGVAWAASGARGRSVAT
jgi:hypothetical protein